MRQITIKDFHQNMWNEIKELPCEVTRNNVPIFKVSSVTVGELKELPQKISKKFPEGTPPEVVEEVIAKQEEKDQKLEEAKEVLKEMYPMGNCNYPYCYAFANGQGKDGKYYCEKHLKEVK